MSMILQLEHVSSHYGEFEAIRDITFEVGEGETVSIIGANGAGKSTTLNVISGIIRPSSGKILFKGEHIDGMPTNQIVDCGIVQVPEGRKLFPYLSVKENLLLGAFNSKARKEIKSSLDTVYDFFPRLMERENQLAGTLSGGEQQMAAIGRGLMAKPSLLMMDEPSLGLAPIIVEQVFETIETIKKFGITVLLVEQNVFRACKIADRAYVIENGKIMLSGYGEKLLENPYIKEAFLGM